MERWLKNRASPKFRCRKHPTRPQALFSPPIFSLAREKIGPPEARQKRPRRNEPPQATSLFLCARFFLSKPQAKLAVWVFVQICGNLSVSAAPSQHPYPFCPFGTFPPDRGNRPLGGEPFSAAFSSASCRKPAQRAAGQKNRPPSPHICPQHAHVLRTAEQKPRNCAHFRRLRPRRRVFCVIFNVLSIKSLNFAGNNAKNFIF